MIPRIELIGYLIDEGIIKEMESRQQEFDKGQTLLNKLVNVCLLEGGSNFVKMHDLLRDMALQIQGDGSGAMIKPGTQLKEFPGEGKWTEDLTRVSLMENDFMKIHSSHSPRCPSLSTLLLCRNTNLEHIGNLFFKKLVALKILDMSDTSISILPDAISDLVHLTTLLVYGCAKLRFMPSLAKLKRLKKLDVSHTGLEEVPQDLKLLQNLKHLDLYGTQIKKFPIGLLPMFSRLQFLGFVWPPQTSIRIIEELECLRKLEALSCCFNDVFEFNKYLLGFQRQCNKSSSTDFDNHAVSSYQFVIGPIRLEIDRLIHRNPRDNHFSKSLNLYKCEGVSCLVSCLLPGIFDGLEMLRLFLLENLHALIGREESTPGTLPSSGVFSCLKKLDIMLCGRLKRLFPGRVLENLQNLEEMLVAHCKLLEEIIETEEESMRLYFPQQNRVQPPEV